MRQLLKAVAHDKMHPSKALNELLAPNSKRTFEGKVTKCSWDKKDEGSIKCKKAYYEVTEFSKNGNKSCFKFVLKQTASFPELRSSSRSDITETLVSKNITETLVSKSGCIEELGSNRWSLQSTELRSYYMMTSAGPLHTSNPVPTELDLEIRPDQKTCVPLRLRSELNYCETTLADCKIILSYGENFQKLSRSKREEVLKEINSTNNSNALKCLASTKSYHAAIRNRIITSGQIAYETSRDGRQVLSTSDELKILPSAPEPLDDLNFLAGSCSRLYKDLYHLNWFKDDYMRSKVIRAEDQHKQHSNDKDAVR